MTPAAIEWYEVLLRLGVAAALGGLIGVERGATGHEAGLRTHVLVALGSGLFAVLSVGAFDGFFSPRADTNVNVDVTRIAAYVAPGIGFIGAGVIVKGVRAGAPLVLGLTTAASLWAAAAIGVAAGLGFWSGAIAAAVIAVVVLVVVRPLSAALERRGKPARPMSVVVEADEPIDVETILARIPGVGDVRGARYVRGDHLVCVTIDCDLPHDLDPVRLTMDLAQGRGVRSVSIGSDVDGATTSSG